MDTRLQFNKTTVTLSFNEDITDHADIDIFIDNNDEKGDPGVGFLRLREHEAEYLARAILHYIELNRKDNERFNSDQVKKNQLG